MYKDASRWSLAFQSYVQLTMAEVHRKETVSFSNSQGGHYDYWRGPLILNLRQLILVLSHTTKIESMFSKFWGSSKYIWDSHFDIKVPSNENPEYMSALGFFPYLLSMEMSLVYKFFLWNKFFVIFFRVVGGDGGICLY